MNIARSRDLLPTSSYIFLRNYEFAIHRREVLILISIQLKLCGYGNLTHNRSGNLN